MGHFMKFIDIIKKSYVGNHHEKEKEGLGILYKNSIRLY